jgi:hypothetical protein
MPALLRSKADSLAARRFPDGPQLLLHFISADHPAKLTALVNFQRSECRYPLPDTLVQWRLLLAGRSGDRDAGSRSRRARHFTAQRAIPEPQGDSLSIAKQINRDL